MWMYLLFEKGREKGERAKRKEKRMEKRKEQGEGAKVVKCNN
jgi:hypothetical protein